MEKFTFFWLKNSPFSQWYSSQFTYKNINFVCAEQAMMYEKAMLFGDREIGMKILRETKPNVHKALGRQVRNFKNDVWDSKCKEIVYNINKAKFTQNKRLLQILMNTKGTTLVEASPKDRIWGIGLEASDPKASDRTQWRGKNWLGEVLTNLRNDIEKNGS